LALTAARYFGVGCYEAPQLSHNKKAGAATSLSDVGIFCEKFVLVHLFDYFRRIMFNVRLATIKKWTPNGFLLSCCDRLGAFSINKEGLQLCLKNRQARCGGRGLLIANERRTTQHGVFPGGNPKGRGSVFAWQRYQSLVWNNHAALVLSCQTKQRPGSTVLLIRSTP